MDAYGIIILNKIGNNVTIYANSLKKGYYVLCCTRAAIDRKAMVLQWPEVKLLELNPGKHYLYCIDDNNATDGDVQIDIGYDTEQEQLQNVLISNGLTESAYTNIIKTLKTVDYIVELYNQYKTTDNNIYDTLLSVLVGDYNARQEQLNYFVEPLFLTNQNTGNIVSYRKQLYTFIPYRYNTAVQRWDVLPECIIRDADTFMINELPTGLYKIIITINGTLIRAFYWYEPVRSVTEQKVQKQIDLNKTIAEKGAELIGTLQEQELEQDASQIIAAMLDFDIPKPVLRKPEIAIDQYKLTVTIPDYDLILLSQKTCYLALLELTEVYANKQNPHRIPITGSSFQVNALQYLPNSDTEYIAYIVDEDNTILSQGILISFDTEYPVIAYTNVYQKIELDRYTRKLYSVFKEYDINEWSIVSSICDRYLLNSANTLSFSEFVLTQLTYLDSNQYNISFMMQLVLLCDLQYFTDIDQSFVTNQVYAVPYKTHIFPQRNLSYIICATKIYDNKITYQYYRAGNGGTEIRIDQGEIVFLQAIDPVTWKKSSIAFYNNQYPGAPYFYFPKLEVTVNHGLY